MANHFINSLYLQLVLHFLPVIIRKVMTYIMIFFNPRLIDLRSEQFVDIECRRTKRGMSKCGTTENMHLGLSYCIKS